MTSSCICGHAAADHEDSQDWCNARGCPCQRFSDVDQSDLFDDEEDFDDDDEEDFDFDSYDPSLEDFE